MNAKKRHGGGNQDYTGREQGKQGGSCGLDWCPNKTGGRDLLVGPTGAKSNGTLTLENSWSWYDLAAQTSGGVGYVETGLHSRICPNTRNLGIGLSLLQQTPLESAGDNRSLWIMAGTHLTWVVAEEMLHKEEDSWLTAGIRSSVSPGLSYSSACLRVSCSL